MKKILVGILSFAFLFVLANSLSASSVWNGASNDCPTVAVANYTTNTGYVNPCWPLTTVNANPGDSVNVRIYYHNTGTQNNTNTRVILNAPTGTSTSHSFSGQIVSDQGSISFGPVYVKLSSSQKLSFGSTRWYPNQTQTHTSLPYGQDGSELIGGGLNIGTITPSWSSQGSVVVSFYVNKPQPTGNITASNSSCIIQAGNSSCDLGFTWSTENPVTTSVVTRDGGSTVATGNSGSKSFSIPYNGATFRLYNNAIELDSESVTASCASNTTWNGNSCVLPLHDCEIVSFTANQNSVPSGSPVLLSWTTNYCKSVNISGIGSSFSANGSKTVYPTDTTTYVLTGYGDTSVTPTKSLTIIAGGPVYAPGFPAGAPGYSAN
ncbi:MAG: hypothetical protein PHT84_01670 [Candidatus Pacebacteria bacterium]|nr:hypothetical protein [Candidatus Paceibacterota bacterium]